MFALKLLNPQETQFRTKNKLNKFRTCLQMIHEMSLKKWTGVLLFDLIEPNTTVYWFQTLYYIFLYTIYFLSIPLKYMYRIVSFNHKGLLVYQMLSTFIIFSCVKNNFCCWHFDIYVCPRVRRTFSLHILSKEENV